jgi:NAD(P)-dependent dehydrogenase (short-subunit alcohol dehydrogenase family)
MDRSLAGRVALVTGAGPGIGRATALAFARDGADVVVAARRAEPLAALAEEVAAETGRRVLAMPTDITDLEACTRLIAGAVEALGRLDVLVNVATASFPRRAIVDADWNAYLDSVALNVVGTMKLCGEAARVMAGNGGGSIINIGTLGTTALQAKNGTYTSTKLAMVGLSKTLAREVGPQHVRVNVVTPGFTTGEPLDRLFEEMGRPSGRSGEEMSRRVAAAAALERHVDPEDIAEACLYLGSDRGRNVTGVELHVTAGALIV